MTYQESNPTIMILLCESIFALYVLLGVLFGNLFGDLLGDHMLTTSDFGDSTSIGGSCRCGSWGCRVNSRCGRGISRRCVCRICSSISGRICSGIDGGIGSSVGLCWGCGCFWCRSCLFWSRRCLFWRTGHCFYLTGGFVICGFDKRPTPMRSWYCHRRQCPT